MDVDNCDESVLENETDDDINASKRLLRKQTVQSKQQCAKDERNATIRKVSLILQKAEDERSEEDLEILKDCSEIVKEVQSRRKKRDEAKRRIEEYEEPIEKLREKCVILAQAIAQSQHLVVYTGAGISTAARIPDYRGTNGIWTRLQQGKDIGNHDLSLAEPTYTHMALSELYRRNILKYVVSQNCDGLHLRSGLPRTAISEVHGNMYIEVCKTCKPSREYWRLFDVTENTARYSHKTMRKCYSCNGPLNDTIVHFGERGSLQWPLNWSGASKNARKATTIVCLGSSLKVLKKYPWLWQMHKPVKRRPNLYIVNLQWTPKDDCANIKINGKCDVVMEIVMELLGIAVPKYDRNQDPIFVHGTLINEHELHTTTQPFLKHSEEKEEEVKDEAPDEPLNCHKDLSPSSEKDRVNCDTISNIYSINNSKVPSRNDSSSLPKIHNTLNTTFIPQPAHHNMFSISGLLQTSANEQMRAHALNLVKKEFEESLLNGNCQALLTYYQLSNSLFQNPLLAYRDVLNYPFQTNFVYSGLHSIINPIPIISEEHNYSFNEGINNTSVKEEVEEEEEEVKDPECDYCAKNYKSDLCLYYTKYEPKFETQQLRFSKIENCEKALHCICCDYTTEEEDENDQSAEDVSPDKISKISSDPDASEQKPKIQPGWFGKGYRKNRKYKKKLAS